MSLRIANVEVPQIQEWIAAAEKEFVELSRQDEALQFKIAEARRRLMLLHELLASISSGPVALPGDVVEGNVRDRVRLNVRDVLASYGTPMRIQDIHTEFVRRGLPLPGRGTPTNIVAHISGDDSIVRIARGVYGLRDWTDERATEVVSE